uniref:Uncharacterized protein n=1 Tax=Siphoviridae sp. ctxdc10 TaxID=2825740 RepID=A0A8S5TSI5_9CAUD|nr:MAG TPA: hypothetical protein [Siphoviridae sp. ctxdc10]
MRERPAQAPKLRRHERRGSPGQISALLCPDGFDRLSGLNCGLTHTFFQG